MLGNEAQTSVETAAWHGISGHQYTESDAKSSPIAIQLQSKEKGIEGDWQKEQPVTSVLGKVGVKVLDIAQNRQLNNNSAQEF